MITEESGSANDGGAGFAHVPVLLEETLELLDPQPGKLYVDCTAGAGGHLLRIAEKACVGDAEFLKNNPCVIGIDRDEQSLSNLAKKVGPGVRLIHSNYEDIRSAISKYGINTISGGIIADLGVSSMQLDDPDRGFSFLRNGPLDMRMDASQITTAAEIINNLSEFDLAEIIFRYGEERHSRLIARNIVKARPLRTTLELAEIVSRSIPRNKKKGTARDTSHPATRTFQALRIAVNSELTSLEKFVDEAIDLLEPGAKIVVITFHSLEDRLVKQIFKRASIDCVCPPRQPVCTCDHKSKLLIITRKPVVAAEKEILANIRSRSAKLRAGQKLD
ncbi:MAG TPA: 16S rRNA (cytosine(1402)-N(4))-methyltransferase RsmH [Drouetiella sp.]